ncbi:MAG: Rab family GTPase [Candidatus Helarchaeota archaeon]
MENETNTMRYKMVLFGNEKVGKTSLVERFINNRFIEDYLYNLGYNIYEKIISYQKYLISLMIYDIGGQEKFDVVRKIYARGADTAFIIYDITNKKSFNNLKKWRDDLYKYAGIIPFMIIGNKIDLENKRKVSKQELINTSKELNAIGYFETSAKTGEYVDMAFNQLAIETLKTHLSKNA